MALGNLGSSKELVIAVIGATGAGKSSVLNTLADDPSYFKAADSNQSCTEETVKKIVKCSRTGRDLDLVDTQGTQDTGGRDAEFVKEIQEFLRTVPFVHAFVFVMNASTRMLQYVDTLKTFRQMFGPEFMGRLIFCFTHMTYDTKTEKKKTKSLKKQEEKVEHLRTMMRDELSDSRPFPCVFFDNELTSDKEDAEESDIKELDSNVKVVIDFAANGTPYNTSSISQDSVLTAVDATKAKERGSEVTRQQLQQFEDFIKSTRADETKDSFHQYGLIAESQDRFIDVWISEVAEYGEHVYDIFDEFKLAMQDKLQQVRIDLFGAEFVSRQQALITQVCGHKDALRKCPFCGIVWWNEGGCNQRRCGHQGAPRWGTEIVPVEPRGRNRVSHGCGRQFEWQMAKPVAQETLKEILKPHKVPALRQPKQVEKSYFKEKRGRRIPALRQSKQVAKSYFQEKKRSLLAKSKASRKSRN